MISLMKLKEWKILYKVALVALPGKISKSAQKEMNWEKFMWPL